jgi:hypothetical protein
VETVTDDASIDVTFQKIFAAVKCQHAAKHAKQVSLEPLDVDVVLVSDFVPTTSGLGLEQHGTASVIYWQATLCQFAALMIFFQRASVLDCYDQDYPIVHPDEETYSACTKSTLDSDPTVVSDEAIYDAHVDVVDNDTADDDVFMDVQSINLLFDSSMETGGGDCDKFHVALTEVPITEDDPGFNHNPGDSHRDHHYCQWTGAKPKEKQKVKLQVDPQSSTSPASKVPRNSREEIQSYDQVGSIPFPDTVKRSSGQAQSDPKPSLFMEQPSDETGETKWYPNCMQLFPRWSWTLLPLENVDKLCKASAANAELVSKCKFGVEVTTNTRRALDNNLWYKAFQREMSQLLDYKIF